MTSTDGWFCSRGEVCCNQANSPQSEQEYLMGKKRQQSLKHEVFGPLARKVGDLWEGTTGVELFGEQYELPLLVTISEEDGAEACQVSAFEKFKRHQKRLQREVEQQLFDYYQSVCDQYRVQFGATTPDHPTVPIITTVKEMARLVTLEAVYCTYGEPSFGLLFKCSWDPELGIAVVIEGRHVMQVGPQDILL